MSTVGKIREYNVNKGLRVGVRGLERVGLERYGPVVRRAWALRLWVDIGNGRVGGRGLAAPLQQVDWAVPSAEAHG